MHVAGHTDAGHTVGRQLKLFKQALFDVLSSVGAAEGQAGLSIPHHVTCLFRRQGKTPLLVVRQHLNYQSQY